MSKDKIKKIHILYGCITGLLVLTVGIFLIFSCVSIYNSGERPFSRESIVTVARQLAIPGWLCLLAVLGGIILHHFLPLNGEKAKPIHFERELLKRFESNYFQLPADGQRAIESEMKRIQIIKAVTVCEIFALCIYPLVYFADASHFGVADINSDICRAVMIALIPTVISFASIYLYDRVTADSVRRQIQIYKDFGVKPGKMVTGNLADNRVNILRCVLVGAAILLIVMGIANDGIADVLGKAIRICTECIGLG